VLTVADQGVDSFGVYNPTGMVRKRLKTKMRVLRCLDPGLQDALPQSTRMRPVARSTWRSSLTELRRVHDRQEHR
jgi:hypothetical protein